MTNSKRFINLVSLTLFLLCSSVFTFAQELEDNVFIDLGPNDVTNGNVSLETEKITWYWNNVTNISVDGSAVSLKNKKGENTTYNISVTKGFLSNGILTGGLLKPLDSLLGDMAINTATQDYFFTTNESELIIYDLDPTKAYKFSVFGSRNSTSARISGYKLLGQDVVQGQLQTSGTDIGGSGYHGNNSNVYVSDYVYPDAEGAISLTIYSVSGSFAYINAMKLDGFDLTSTTPELDESLYVDFGPNDTKNGNITLSPVLSGKYWNNIIDVSLNSSVNNLKNTLGQDMDMSVTIQKAFKSNGINNGALLSPSEDLLGSFAITTATQDYFFTENTSKLKLSGLDQSKVYCFSIFGSRQSTEERISEFNFSGDNTVIGKHQTSGSNLGGSGYHGNNSTIYTSEYVYPNSNNEIELTLSILSGSYAYINAIQIGIYNFSNVIPITGFEVSGNSINESGKESQMTVSFTPETASRAIVLWSVDDESIASIDEDGVVRPIKNGAITVTAKCYGADSLISASKNITISNQIIEMYIAENEADMSSYLEMNRCVDSKMTVSNIFDLFIDASENLSFKLMTSTNVDNAITFGGNNGNLIVDGESIVINSDSPILLTVDLNQETYTVRPIMKWTLIGLAEEKQLDYIGHNKWSSSITITEDDASFFFRANDTTDLDLKKASGFGSELRRLTYADEFGLPYENIGVPQGTYNVKLNLEQNTYSVGCIDTSSQSIIFMGSSVCNGQGAVNNQGYAYLYNQLLEQRQLEDGGNVYDYFNISVGGNNTLKLMDRWEADLVPLCGEYIVYGLSLGNEGIHENGQQAFDQYRDNMLILIEEARNRGLKPIIMNNYTRADFTPEDYEYIKEMNFLINQWDVPSVNLLGAIDDGSGHWASGYVADNYHPNTEGHKELSYAMVPSLFDALELGKEMPKRINNTEFSFSATEKILFSPENIVHSFTHSFAFKTSSVGLISSLNTENGEATLSVNNEGLLVYTNPNGDSITSTMTCNENKWGRISLTHYYANGVSILYLDDNEIGRINEKISLRTLSLQQCGTDNSTLYKEWFFYRSGMNSDEISAFQKGVMLQSSLELYAPLDKISSVPLSNYAQSTNTLQLISTVALDDFVGLDSWSVFPNPTNDKVCISGKVNVVSIKVYNNNGCLVENVTNNYMIDTSCYQEGLYLLNINNTDWTKLVVQHK